MEGHAIKPALHVPGSLYGAKFRVDGCRFVLEIQLPRHVVLSNAKLLDPQNIVGVVSNLASDSDCASSRCLITAMPDLGAWNQAVHDDSALLDCDI